MKAKKFLEVLDYNVEDQDSQTLFAFDPICQCNYIIKQTLARICFIRGTSDQNTTIKEVFDTLKRFPYKEVRFYASNRYGGDNTKYLDLPGSGNITLDRPSYDYLYTHFRFRRPVWISDDQL